MPSGPTPTNKFTAVKFIHQYGNFDVRGLKFYVNNNAHYRYFHYLPLNTNKELHQLAHEIGIAAKELNGLSKYELTSYLNKRIEFQIPAELAHLERRPSGLLNTVCQLSKN